VSTGRFEKRTARAVTVEICPEEEGRPKERTLTENVSAHGARVLMERSADRAASNGYVSE